MSPIHIFLLITCLVATEVACKSTMGNFFQEQHLPDSNVMKDTATASILQESFPICSVKEECHYVLKDTRSGVFSIRESDNHLPADKRYFRIWKKVKPVTHCDSNPCKNGGRCVPDIASYSCVCDAGSTGRSCENATCKSLKEAGKKSGIYTVLLPSGIFKVYCEMDINGGVYTFISKNVVSAIKQSDIDSIFTDKSNVLLRLLKPDNSQPYTIIQQYIDTGGLSVQLNAFHEYSQPKHYAASDYLFLGVLPQKDSRESQVEGLKSNGVNVTFTTCDRSGNSYFAFYSTDVANDQLVAACDATHFDTNWRKSAIYPNTSSIITNEFFMSTEIQFGGCGCYAESGSWPSRDYPANATAIGLR